MAFLDCPRGHRVPRETRVCFARIGLTASVDTSPRIRASQVRWPTRKWLQERQNRPSDAQAARCFRWSASKLTSFFQTVKTIEAIFLATVRRAMVGLLPLASKA
jgi:hypothetical protein